MPLQFERAFDEAGSLSEPVIRELCLEYLDTIIYNDLPQYLVRISDMKLYSRNELWEHARPLIETMPIDTEKARDVPRKEVRNSYKKDVQRLLGFAIFSHKWGRKEPAFRDMSSKINGRKPPPTGPGYEKLVRFCEKSKEYGCEYVWSDTCCINKESSAELEEAIRSMYRWYQDALVCIVYLAKSSSVADFPNEPWFTRGWTLQELLAPANLRIYGKDWTPICPKEKENTLVRSPIQLRNLRPERRHTSSPSDHFPNDKRSVYMVDAISKVTGITAQYVRTFHAEEVSVSEKMSWASKRRTTRVEDIAYSLLGIFNVSMPIAYGEGHTAFRRLLEVVAQQSQDTTFFAWAGIRSDYSRALPASPSAFGTKVTAFGRGDRGYTIQKFGVQVDLLLIQVKIGHLQRDYTLQPLDPDLSRIMTMSSRLRHRPDVFSGETCALGVVNFDRRLHHRDDASNDDDGFLFAGKQYFGVLIKPCLGSLPKTFGLPSLKLDTGDLLPTVECKEDYGAHTTTICLVHKH